MYVSILRDYDDAWSIACILRILESIIVEVAYVPTNMRPQEIQ